MSQIKNFLFDVMEMLDNGMTVEEIAKSTNMPVSFIAETVAQFELESLGFDDDYETDSP